MIDPFKILNTFQPNNTAERVFVQLKNMLFSYEIVPGQKLQYQDLAEKFNVSRTPVKDALNMLEKEGYLELRHNKGYYVAEITLKEAQDLFDIREALELLAVRKAIENLSKESLKVLKDAMEAYSMNVKMPLSRHRLILDSHFHLRIAEMAQNASLVEILQTTFAKIYLKHRVETLSPQRGEEADSEHKELYKAISSENVSSAVEVVKKHIGLSRKNILGSLF